VTPVGVRLRRLRERVHLQPEQVAAALSISGDQWIAFEEGDALPTPELLVRAADFFLITPPAILLEAAGYHHEATEARNTGWAGAAQASAHRQHLANQLREAGEPGDGSGAKR
jgi:transcriptional regulator with XRE-family HTH domain